MAKREKSSRYGTVVGTTPEERRAFVEKQRADRVKYGNRPPGLIPGGHGMDFIDRAGNIIHPTREAYEASKLRYPLKKGSGAYGGKPVDRRRHYHSQGAGEDERTRQGYSGLVSGLEVFVTALGIIGGIFFLSSSLTGNVISDMANSTSNFLGASLLMVGLVAGFFYIKSKK